MSFLIGTIYLLIFKVGIYNLNVYNLAFSIVKTIKFLFNLRYFDPKIDPPAFLGLNLAQIRVGGSKLLGPSWVAGFRTP